MDETFTLLLDLADRLVSDGEDLARVSGFAAAGTIAAALDLARVVGEAAEPTSLIDAVSKLDPDGVAARYCLAVTSCFAAVRADYPSRQDAISARARLSDEVAAIYPLLGQAGADAVDFLVMLSGAAVRALSDIAASRAPLVRVETNVSLPSTVLAYDLYAAPERAAELVQRNRSATPLIMPATLEAVAT